MSRPGRRDRSIYVETRMRAPLVEVFARSQSPEDHTRWDLRFTRISPQPRVSLVGHQRFSYAVGPVTGVGVTVAERQLSDGTATSSLRFASADWRSPIAAGSGYWSYVPTADGTRFSTGYRYSSRWPWKPVDGVVGAILGWATAWSFDRLRLWVDEGQTPEQSLRRAFGEVVLRVVMALAAVLSTTALWPTLRSSAALAATLLTCLVVVVGCVCCPAAPRTPSARRCRRVPTGAVRRSRPAALAGPPVGSGRRPV